MQDKGVTSSSERTSLQKIYQMREVTVDRRSVLKLVGGAAVGGGMSSLVNCASAPTYFADDKVDLDNLETLHKFHRKLAFTEDDRLVYWNIDALRMGYKDGVLTPFWNMHAGLTYKVENISAFRYRVKHIFSIFYSDLETGELLEEFKNPYTGEIRKAFQPGVIKSERIFGLNGHEYEPRSNLTRDESLGPAKIIGDDIWLNADSIYTVNPPNRLNRVMRVNDWSTFHGSVRDLLDPAVRSAPATHTFNDINTFNSDWAGMKGIRAWSISRGFGRKSFSVDGMPEEWKRFAEMRHPELLADSPEFS